MSDKNKWGVDRFDLEERIYSMNTSIDDLKVVAEMMYDSDLTYSADRVHTVLYGLAEVMEAKQEKLWDTFIKYFELDKYASYVSD